MEEIAYTESNSKSYASKKFNVDKKRIKEWRKSRNKFLSLRKKDHGAKRKRLDGAGHKPLDQQIEEVLVKWIYNQPEKDCKFRENC